MENFKRESWEEFQQRLEVDLYQKCEDENLYWARFIYFNSIYVNEQNLNWRKQIVRIKKLLTAIRENGNTD